MEKIRFKMNVVSDEEKTFWLSFSGDGINLGCCIVDASDKTLAVIKAHNLGINPGGEVMIIEMPDTDKAREEVRFFGKDRLISREELFNSDRCVIVKDDQD